MEHNIVNIIHVILKIVVMFMFLYHMFIFDTRNSAKAGIWAIIFAIAMGY